MCPCTEGEAHPSQTVLLHVRTSRCAPQRLVNSLCSRSLSPAIYHSLRPLYGANEPNGTSVSHPAVATQSGGPKSCFPPLYSSPSSLLPRMQRFLRECVADVTGAAAPLTSRCVRRLELRARPLPDEERALKNTQYTPHTPRALAEAYTETYRVAGDLSSRTPRGFWWDVTVSCLLIATLNTSALLGRRDQTNKPDYGVLKGKVTWLDRICCGFGY